MKKMKLPIYMDYSATTPVDPRVASVMIPYLTEKFGNPASRSHAFGWEADAAVELAREQVAALVNADPKEIIWTSGATESNNLAIKGAVHFYQGKGKHVITMSTEHKAVLDTVRELEREGFSATYLDPEPNGLLDVEKFKAALRSDTVLASVMLVNNEIGVIQDIAAIGEICRDKGILFHVDAAQASGGTDARRRARARHALRYAADAPDRRHGGGIPHSQGRDGAGERAYAHAARPPAERPDDHGRSARQRRHGTARTAQPQPQLQFCRGRIADDGDQGCCGVQRLGLYLGEPGTILRAASQGE